VVQRWNLTVTCIFLNSSALSDLLSICLTLSTSSDWEIVLSIPAPSILMFEDKYKTINTSDRSPLLENNLYVLLAEYNQVISSG
jgi:hypothetical protein